jgi:hypothetical protein
LAERDGGGTVEHPDAEQDAAMVHPIIQALELLTSRVEELERLVVEELFGGIEKLYRDGQRKTGIGSLKEKYGSLFEPHLPVLAELAPGEDVFEKIFDLLEGSDMDDEAKDGAVKGYAQSIADKINKIKSAGAPAAVEIEVTKTEAAPVNRGQAFLDKVREMAKK